MVPCGGEPFTSSVGVVGYVERPNAETRSKGEIRGFQGGLSLVELYVLHPSVSLLLQIAYANLIPGRRSFHTGRDDAGNDAGAR